MLVTGVTPLMGFPRRRGRQLSWQLPDFTLEGWGQAVHAFALKPKQWQKAGLDRECKKWCWNSVRTSHTVDRAVHHFKHVICISLLHVCNNPRRVFFLLKSENLRPQEGEDSVQGYKAGKWRHWELDPYLTTPLTHPSTWWGRGPVLKSGMSLPMSHATLDRWFPSGSLSLLICKMGVNYGMPTIQGCWKDEQT